MTCNGVGCDRCDDRGSRQAIVLIHGIGEQRPMQTLRDFVESVWHRKGEGNLHCQSRHVVWSKPDFASRSFELRRLTTDYDTDCTRTDFFEFYWAHLMVGTKVNHASRWLGNLFLRWPWKIPRPLRFTYWFIWIAVALLVAGSVWLLTVWQWWQSLIGSGVIGGMLVGVVRAALSTVVGDAARYLSPMPGNVKVRQSIREAGVDLIQELHGKTANGKPKYDRIVIVGHSLGSVIGYDVLTHLWPRYNRLHGNTPNEKSKGLQALEAHARKLSPFADELRNKSASRYQWRTSDELVAVEAREYREKQRVFFSDLQQMGNPWRVTDFVTLGSPLTYADILLAEDPSHLWSRQQSREFPTCPPVLEIPTQDTDPQRNELPPKRLSYPDEHGTVRVPHFAAVFAPVRWTNLYFPARFALWGDIIGGPLGEVFGYGIVDIPLARAPGLGWLSHTKYWNFVDQWLPLNVRALADDSIADPKRIGCQASEPAIEPPGHIAALRRALALSDGIAAANRAASLDATTNSPKSKPASDRD